MGFKSGENHVATVSSQSFADSLGTEIVEQRNTC